MGPILLFWLTTQPDDSMDGTRWEAFHELLAFMVLIAVALTVATTVALYRQAARTKLIRSPGDLFGPYTPMWWLALALAPGVVVCLAAWYMYSDTFTDSTVSFFGYAAGVGAYTTLLSLIISFLLFPLVTPAKFKYRVWKPLR